MPLQKPSILHMIDFRKILKLGFICVMKTRFFVYVLAGRLLRNLARTIPLFPWARVTFPQITLVLFGLPPGVTVLFFALYT